jgi:hypothetical protein
MFEQTLQISDSHIANDSHLGFNEEMVQKWWGFELCPSYSILRESRNFRIWVTFSLQVKKFKASALQ